MARRNHPLNLPAPYRIRRTITATDPLQPGESWEFELEARPDSGTATRVDELSGEYSRRFLVGAGDDGPEELFDSGGNQVVVTKMLCDIIATLVVMEEGASEDGKAEWDFEEWAIFSAVAPAAFGSVVGEAEKMRAEADGRLKKPSGATPKILSPSGEAEPALPCTTEPPTTPESLSELIP